MFPEGAGIPSITVGLLLLLFLLSTPALAAPESSADFILQNFSDPTVRESIARSDGVQFEKTKEGIKLKEGYLGSSQPKETLKPAEIQALEALKQRELKGRVLPEFVFSENVRDGYAIRYGGKTIRMRHTGSNADASFEQSALVYRNAYRDTDVLYVFGGGGCQEMILLRSKKSPARFEYDCKVDGGGEVGINEKGELTAGGLTLSNPVIFDASGKRTEGQYKKTAGEIVLAFNPKGLKYPILIDPVWRTAGTLNQSRYSHTATLLPSGKVLIAGGYDSTVLKSAELFDPLTGIFTITGDMQGAGWGHTATLLPNGKVLFVGTNLSPQLYHPDTGTFTQLSWMNYPRGGQSATLLNDGTVLLTGGNGNILTAEVYDPSDNHFHSKGSMAGDRIAHAAVLLPNGKVLIVGGVNMYGGLGYLASAEVYDPSAGSFEATGSMAIARAYPTATLLPNGKVLVAGGHDGSHELSSAEVYDPSTGQFTYTDNFMAIPRTQGTATLLPDGKVLIVSSNSGDLYDPYSGSNGTFTSAGSMAYGRYNHTATLLPDGKVLIAAGSGGGNTAEFYDPSVGTFETTDSMAYLTYYHTATLLPNGKVLITGGRNGVGTVFSNAEVFDPNAGINGDFSSAGSMTHQRVCHTATLLPDGKVLLAGGQDIINYAVASAEIYDPTSGTFDSAGVMTGPRSFHTATLLPNGTVLLTGGFNDYSYHSNAELYYPVGRFWATAGTMHTARSKHTATLLLNGKVLIAGGENSEGVVASAEVYDPTSGTFVAVGSMAEGRNYHTATLLADGRVIVAGGYGASSKLSSAELFNPTTNQFSATGAMNSARIGHTATLLPNNKVLITGGEDGGGALSSIEVYDPSTGSFEAAGFLVTEREYHTATLMPNGKILVVGDGFLGTIGEIARYTEYDYTGKNIQPIISSFTAQIEPGGGPYTITGTGLKGTSEASGGNIAMNSPTNYPRVYLQKMDTGNIGVMSESGMLIDVTTTEYPIDWPNADTSISFKTPSNLPSGYYLLTVVANAVPSAAKTVYYEPPEIYPPDPSAPTGFIGTAESSTSIRWSWEDVWGEDGYQLFDQDHNLVMTVPADTTTTVETGLTANLLCTREVRAYHAWGSAESGAASIYTLAATPDAPSVYGGYDVTNGYRCDITVNTAGNPGGTYYAVTSDEGTSWLKADGTTTTETFWQTATLWYQKDLSANTTYTYKVKARNEGNIQTSLSSDGSDTTPPAAPTGLVTTNITTNSADCNWQTVTGANSYYIKWGTDVNATNEGGSVALRPYHFGGQNPGSTRYWKVRAISSTNGSGEYSSIASYTTLFLAPPAPGWFIGTAESTSSITWAWEDVAGEDGYQLLDEGYNVIDTLPADTTTTVEAGLSVNTQYTRYIRAYNAGGSNESSSESRYTLADAAVSPTVDGGYDVTNGYYCNVSWESGGAQSGFSVWRWDSVGGWVSVYFGTETTTLDANLAADTSYSYYIFAYNGDVVVTDSVISSNTTPPSAPGSGTLITTDTTTNSASSTWEAVPDAESYVIRWGTDEAATNGGEITTTEAAYTWTDLLPEEEYYWEVAAVNTNGTGEYSGIVSFETLALAPPAPGWFIGTAESTSSIIWAWEDVAGEDGYQLLDEGYNVIDTLPADTVTTTETGLSVNTQYTRYIRAYSAGGNSDTGPVSRYTWADAPVSPSVVGGYDPALGYYCNVSWESGGAQSGFQVWRIIGDWTLISDLAGTTTVEANLLANTSYTYYIFAYNGDYLLSANISSSNTTPPSAPGSGTLITTDTTTNSASSTWEAVPDAESYVIRWGTDPDATNGGEITTTEAAYTWTDLLPEEEYYWEVAAVNTNGTGEYSGIVSFETLALAPPAPSYFIGTAESTSSIIWAWEDVAGEDGYQLLDDGYNVITVIPADTATTVEGGLNPNQQYTRYIRAYSAGGNSDTGPVSRYTLADAPVNPQVSGGYDPALGYYCNVSWESGGAQSGYWVFREAGWIHIYDGTGTTTVDAGLAANTPYTYYIYAYNGDSILTGWVSSTGATPPSAPGSGTLITTDTTTNSAYSTWEAVPDAESYVIRWGTDPDATNGGEITTTEAAYTWTDLLPDEEYYWKVAAVNENGTGEYSAIVSFETLALLAPPAPAWFIGTAESTSSITWAWEDVAGEDGYQLLDEGYNVIDTLPADTVTTTETGLSVNTQYTRYIRAYSAGGNSDTGPVSRYTWADIPVGLSTVEVTDSTVKLSWSGNGTRYAVLRFVEGGGLWVYVAVWDDNLTDTEYTDPGLTAQTDYGYRVAAYNGDQVITSPCGAIYTKTLSGGPVSVAPQFNWAKLNGKILNPNAFNYVSPSPEVEIYVTSESGMSTLDAQVSTTSLGVYQTTCFTLVDGTSFEGTWRGTERLAMTTKGDYAVSFRGTDSTGKTYGMPPISAPVTYQLRIGGGTVQMVGGAYNYPNPFTPLNAIPGYPAKKGTLIQYTLSKDTAIVIIIYDMTGHEIKRMKFGSGTEGGSAGMNQVNWEGESSSGKVVGSGMYLCKIISKDNVIGTIKMVVHY